MNQLEKTLDRPRQASKPRLIPTLLLDKDYQLVKTKKFKKRTYIGDPINAVKIFNNKKVDEIILLNIDSTAKSIEPDFDMIQSIVEEAFMPISYGGGITSISDIEKVFSTGVEKVILSSCLLNNAEIINIAAARWGSQSISVCLPVKKNMFGKYEIRLISGKKKLKYTIEDAIDLFYKNGAGEVVIYSIDRDGMYAGYDIDILKRLTDTIKIPLVICGGALSLQNISEVYSKKPISGYAAGSIFVYSKKGQGVLINYPTKAKLNEIFF